MAKGLKVKEVHEIKEAVRYTYLSEESTISEFIKNHETPDVLLYGLVKEKLDNLEWRCKDENNNIVETEDNKEYFREYIKFKSLADEIGNRLV